ncbi:MAG: DUF4270 domain-containing protein [Bacteroidetes bacterium]|nr:DUF4270 domain-containing protein [Bacteroidota bacterium]
MGCREPDIVDVGLNTPANVGYLDSATVELDTFIPTLDSLFTKNVTAAVLGNYTDPVLGRVNAEIYTQISLPGANVAFEADAVADSIVLFLPLVDYYGKPSSRLNLEVYELTESIADGTNYYATSRFATGTTELGGGASFALAADKLGSDTIKIKLNVSLAQRILDATSDQLANNTNFHQFFKGLHIKTQPVVGDVGVVYTVALRNVLVGSAAPASLKIYYRGTGENKVYTLTVQSGVTQRTNYLERGDISGTLLGQLVGDAAPIGRQVAILQSIFPVQVRAKISKLPANRIAINRAILELPVDTTYVDSNPFLYYRPIPRSLQLYQADETGEKIDRKSAILNQSDFLPATDRYEFNITSYLNQYYEQDGVINDLLLVPNSLALVFTSSGLPTFASAARSVLGNIDHPTRRPRVRVYYTNLP